MPYPQTFQFEVTVTAMEQLRPLDADVILLQADPDNAVNVLLAFGGASYGHQLEPGLAASAEVANADQVFLGSADGSTAVRVTLTVFSCAPPGRP